MVSDEKQPQAPHPVARYGWSADEIRRLQVFSSHRVTSIFAGAYKSVFRGRGIEFDDLRDYQPGDDIRCIDWSVTARTGRPHIKRFVEEREMTVLLLLDCSASLECPSPRGPKSRVAAEICALLAFAAIRSNDRIGLLTFGEKVGCFIAPAKGKRHAQRLIAAIAGQPPSPGGSDLAGALTYLGRVVRRPAILFIVSDFLCADYQLPLRAVAVRHDVVAVVISDPHDVQIPDVGLLQVADAETGRRRLVDTSSAAVRQSFASHAARRRSELRQILAAAGVDLLTACTTTPPVQSLSRFFQLRQRRMGG
jgi:uncharacterized protein (DUF58 family)